MCIIDFKKKIICLMILYTPLTIRFFLVIIEKMMELWLYALWELLPTISLKRNNYQFFVFFFLKWCLLRYFCHSLHLDQDLSLWKLKIMLISFWCKIKLSQFEISSRRVTQAEAIAQKNTEILMIEKSYRYIYIYILNL
jgi:hypothetical protein